MKQVAILVTALALSVPVATIAAAFERPPPPPPPPPPEYRGAPGPVVGAGLPVLAVGYGVYWLVKRRRKGKQI